MIDYSDDIDETLNTPEEKFYNMLKSYAMQMPLSDRMAYLVRLLWGSKYTWGAEVIGNTDCSGSVTFALYLMGYNIRVTAHGLLHLICDEIRRSDARPGDLAFFWREDGSRVKHVAVFSDNGVLMNAASEFEDVPYEVEVKFRAMQTPEFGRVNWSKARDISASDAHSWSLDSKLKPLFGLFAGGVG